MFFKMLSINMYFKCLNQTQTSGIVTGKLCSSKFSYFGLWFCEISAQRSVGDKLLPGQVFIWTSRIFGEDRHTSVKITLSSGNSGSFPEVWRSRSGCVQERGVLHVGALLVYSLRCV